GERLDPLAVEGDHEGRSGSVPARLAGRAAGQGPGEGRPLRGGPRRRGSYDAHRSLEERLDDGELESDERDPLLAAQRGPGNAQAVGAERAALGRAGGLGLQLEAQ